MSAEAGAVEMERESVREAREATAEEMQAIVPREATAEETQVTVLREATAEETQATVPREATAEETVTVLREAIAEEITVIGLREAAVDRQAEEHPAARTVLAAAVLSLAEWEWRNQAPRIRKMPMQRETAVMIRKIAMN